MGVVPTAATIYEVLEELAITVQVRRCTVTLRRDLPACRHSLTVLRGPIVVGALQAPDPPSLPLPLPPPHCRTSCRRSCPSAPSTAATTCLWMWATRAWAWRR